MSAATAVWRRGTFERACAARAPGGTVITVRRETCGWVLPPCWGAHDEGHDWAPRWVLTHLPTGRRVASFERLRDAKCAAAWLSSKADFARGRFGEEPRRLPGVRAMRAAVLEFRRKRAGSRDALEWMVADA